MMLGFFGPYVYKNKKGENYYLHEWTGKGGKKLLHFSKDPRGAIDLPSEFEVVENVKTGLPTLKKKE